MWAAFRICAIFVRSNSAESVDRTDPVGPSTGGEGSAMGSTSKAAAVKSCRSATDVLCHGGGWGVRGSSEAVPCGFVPGKGAGRRCPLGTHVHRLRRWKDGDFTETDERSNDAMAWSSSVQSSVLKSAESVDVALPDGTAMTGLGPVAGGFVRANTPASRKRLFHKLPVGPRSSETAAGKAEEGGDSMERIVDRRERSQTPPQPTEARWVIRIGSKPDARTLRTGSR